LLSDCLEAPALLGGVHSNHAQKPVHLPVLGRLRIPAIGVPLHDIAHLVVRFSYNAFRCRSLVLLGGLTYIEHGVMYRQYFANDAGYTAAPPFAMFERWGAMLLAVTARVLFASPAPTP
jgi:hypothetical protein